MGACIPEGSKGTVVCTQEQLKKKTVSPTSIFSTVVSISENKNKILNLNSFPDYRDIKKYYKINPSPIGKGGSATVYKALKNDEFDSTKYAIKVIRKNEEENEEIQRTKKIIELLNHENVVKYFDIFEDENLLYYVCEYLEDGDLFDFISKNPNKKLNERECFIIIHQIIKALYYLHNVIGIAHRDIKPENFLLRKKNQIIKDENDLLVKLIDFGTADFLREEGFDYTEQGTLSYIAPEILLQETYGAKVDMWAAGIVLYNMCTGTHPFKVMSDDETLINDIINTPINFNFINNQILKNLAINLLERDPNKRFSAKDALDYIENAKGEFFNKNKDNKLYCTYTLSSIKSMSKISTGFELNPIIPNIKRNLRNLRTTIEKNNIMNKLNGNDNITIYIKRNKNI